MSEIAEIGWHGMWLHTGVRQPRLFWDFLKGLQQGPCLAWSVVTCMTLGLCVSSLRLGKIYLTEWTRREFPSTLPDVRFLRVSRRFQINWWSHNFCELDIDISIYMSVKCLVRWVCDQSQQMDVKVDCLVKHDAGFTRAAVERCQLISFTALCLAALWDIIWAWHYCWWKKSG